MLDTQCPKEGINFDPGSLTEDIQYSLKHLYKILYLCKSEKNRNTNKNKSHKKYSQLKLLGQN